MPKANVTCRDTWKGAAAGTAGIRLNFACQFFLFYGDKDDDAFIFIFSPEQSYLLMSDCSSYAHVVAHFR